MGRWDDMPINLPEIDTANFRVLDARTRHLAPGVYMIDYRGHLMEIVEMRIKDGGEAHYTVTEVPKDDTKVVIFGDNDLQMRW